MLKKSFIGLMVLLLVFFAAMPFIGVNPLKLGAAVKVAAGLGAKLACSGRYVLGFDNAQNMADLASYSPATKLLEITYTDNPTRVHATFLGLAEATARYRPGLGCALEYDPSPALNNIQVPQLPQSQAPWPQGQTVNTLVAEMQSRTEQLLAADNAEGLQTRALLVVKNGEIIAEAYGQGFNAQSPLLGWSMGKSLTSIMLGHYAYLHGLDVEQNQLFPQWQDERAQITLEQLLQMRSGLTFSELYVPGSDSTRMLFMQPSAADYALSQPLAYAPGTHFSYASGTTNILMGYLHQQLGGTTQALVDYFYGQLGPALGLQNSLFEPDSSGVFVGSSYIYASGRDWARMGWLMANGGEINGQRLLSQEWVNAAGQLNDSENGRGYGYQFWLNNKGDELRWPSLPKDAYAMLGNREQRVMIIPSEKTVIVRLGWTAGRYPTNEKFAQLIRAL